MSDWIALFFAEEDMKRYHSDEINRRLERAYWHGSAEFSREELLLWYNKSKITKTIWRDMLERWKKIDEYENVMGIYGRSPFKGNRLNGEGVFVVANLSAFEKVGEKLGQETEDDECLDIPDEE